MSATILRFPKERSRVGRRPRCGTDELPPDVPRLPMAPPPTIERTPELLMAMAIFKALPTEAREKVRTTIRLTADQYGDEAARTANYIMFLLD